MKLEMQLKASDIILLKVLACVLIIFFTFRFSILPGFEKHQDLVDERTQLEEKQMDMQNVMDSKDHYEVQIEQWTNTLKSVTKDYYEVLESQQVDELVTGIVLEHKMFPVSLSIGDTTSGVPAAYLQAAEATADTTSSDEDETKVVEDDEQTSDGTEEETTVTPKEYIHTMQATMTLQGTETQLRELLDDIANNYPGIQVRSFDVSTGTYLNANMKQVTQTTTTCVLNIYTCGDTGEETTTGENES